MVSNSSPLIYLAALSDFRLLSELFTDVLIPPAVYEEVVPHGGSHPVVAAVSAAVGSWIRVEPLRRPELSQEITSQQGIHAGEAEAIVLAQEWHAGGLLMDDWDGAQYATGLGMQVIRTTAVYILAKRRALIPAIGPKLDALRRAGFHLKHAHYVSILKKAGEL